MRLPSGAGNARTPTPLPEALKNGTQKAPANARSPRQYKQRERPRQAIRSAITRAESPPMMSERSRMASGTGASSGFRQA